MHIDTLFSTTELNSDRVEGRTAVVIDVLRATSVMVTALNNGATRVLPVLTPEEGFTIREQQTADTVILGGERHSDPIPGFDFGNSPLDYTPRNVSGKTLVMTTTNGTRALRASQAANELYIAAFLNARAMANHLKNRSKITLVCSGSNNRFTIEDALCAGYITQRLLINEPSASLSDASQAMYNLFLNNQDRYPLLASGGKHYHILKEKGQDADLKYCFKKDLIPVVCQWSGPSTGIIVIP